MKLSETLDTLQTIAMECLQEPYKRYLIELLAEHAEEEEITAGFLEWVRSVLVQIKPT